jgi:hypothetical protein
MQNQPFDHLLNKVAELLQMAYDNAHKPISKDKEAEMNAQLDSLEKQMGELTKVNKKFTEGANLSDYTMQSMLEDEKSEVISPESRQVLKRAEELKAETKAASKDVLQAANNLKGSGKRLTEDKKEKKNKSRKGKFRSVGGVKNWKAL